VPGSVPAVALGALLAAAGVTHFAVPVFYDAMIPEALPGRPRVWTVGSGVAELAVAGAVLHPATRSVGAGAAVALFVGVLPANVKMALDARSSRSAAYRLGTVLRLPLQAPLIAWAWRVHRTAR
jgi:uncharacterized membrane protein